MKRLIKMIKEKWIIGECHHLCFRCPLWSTCKYDFGFDEKYIAGMREGYEKGYQDGFIDGIKENKN